MKILDIVLKMSNFSWGRGYLSNLKFHLFIIDRVRDLEFITTELWLMSSAAITIYASQRLVL